MFPAFPPLAQPDTQRTEQPRQVRRAANGTLRIAVFGPPRRVWTRQWALSAEDCATLRAFVNANRDGEFDFYVHETDETVTARIAGDFAFEPQPGGWWRVTGSLREVV